MKKIFTEKVIRTHITTYVAEDGTQFDDEKSCMNYEEYLEDSEMNPILYKVIRYFFTPFKKYKVSDLTSVFRNHYQSYNSYRISFKKFKSEQFFDILSLREQDEKTIDYLIGFIIMNGFYDVDTQEYNDYICLHVINKLKTETMRTLTDYKELFVKCSVPIFVSYEELLKCNDWYYNISNEYKELMSINPNIQSDNFIKEEGVEYFSDFYYKLIDSSLRHTDTVIDFLCRKVIPQHLIEKYIIDKGVKIHIHSAEPKRLHRIYDALIYNTKIDRRKINNWALMHKGHDWTELNISTGIGKGYYIDWSYFTK